MDTIIENARKLRQQHLDKSQNNLIRPSKLWEGSHEKMHSKAIDKYDTVPEFIGYLTENNAFTLPRLNSDPLFLPVISAYLSYLEKSGNSVLSLPADLEESALVGKNNLFEKEGRKLSAMFLLHLCEALRIRDHTCNIKTTLEIGGGHGSMARIMKTLYPEQCYYIVDLTDSLYCSYVFISANFPNSSILFAVQESDLTNTENYDFVFIPTNLLDSLKNRSFDLVLNTASLGEMTQDSVNYYMDFIENKINARYFYSVNRYGKRDPACSEDQCISSVILDRNWKTRVWCMPDDNGFAQIEPCAPPQLELLMERIPEIPNAHDLHYEISRSLFQLATSTTEGSSLWHYGMWNSIRHMPCQKSISLMQNRLEEYGFNESDYYRSINNNSLQCDLALPTGIEVCNNQKNEYRK